MIAAAIVTFTAFILVMSHLSPSALRRIVGYKFQTDLILHTTIIILFHSTFVGLMQAEAAGILFSISLRIYRWAFGYERFERRNGKLAWVEYEGKVTTYLGARK